MTSYELLQSRAESAARKFHEISDKIKDCEDRLDDITEMKKAIINFAKTKKIYDAYHRSGYSKKFFEEHRAEILLHRSAKEALKNTKGRDFRRLRSCQRSSGEFLQRKENSMRITRPQKEK